MTSAEEKSLVVLDIETIPNADMVDHLPPVAVNKSLKDPEKIAKDKAAKHLKAVQGMALSPLTGRIACIGVSTVGPVQQCFVLNPSNPDASERELLLMLFDVLENTDNAQLVTFNGKSFDVPFLWKRAAILGVELPPRVFPQSMYTRRYTTTPHCDLCEVWSDGFGKDGLKKLDFVGQAVAGAGKLDFDVTKIAQMLNDEDGRSALYNYCLRDVTVTELIYRKSIGILF